MESDVKARAPDHKAIAEMDDIQKEFGGRKPEYILMLFSKRLDFLTRALIILTAILAILTAIQIVLLFLNWVR